MANEPQGSLPGLGDLAKIFANLRSEGPDPERPSSLRSSAEVLAAMSSSPPVIRDRWFKDQTIRVDGYTFERCRFDRCSLVTEMATFTFKQCFISPDCGVYFAGPALKIARLLMHTLVLKGRITRFAGEDTLYAPINDDGTFSLE